jgi:hypothetical protein
MIKKSELNQSRRAALAKLGLAVGTVYAAPVITRLDTAKAAFPSQCPPNRPNCGSNGGGNSGGNGNGRPK